MAAVLSDSDDGFQDFLSDGEEQETLLSQESVAMERRMKTVRSRTAAAAVQSFIQLLNGPPYFIYCSSLASATAWSSARRTRCRRASTMALHSVRRAASALDGCEEHWGQLRRVAYFRP
jgi:hypothetical protein